MDFCAEINISVEEVKKALDLLVWTMTSRVVLTICRTSKVSQQKGIGRPIGWSKTPMDVR